MTDSSDQLVSCNQRHTHPPATAETALEKVKEKMKKRAKEETTPIPTIYHEVLQEVAQSESRDAIAPVLRIYRKRHEKFPLLPQSVDDLNFEGEWSKTHSGDNFMLGSRDGVFMFSTNANLALIAEAYMNGTFQICPRLFYQVFMLHAFKYGQQFPLVYFLLPGKTWDAIEGKLVKTPLVLYAVMTN